MLNVRHVHQIVMEMGNVVMDLGVETRNYPAISLTFVVMINTPEGVSPE